MHSVFADSRCLLVAHNLNSLCAVNDNSMLHMELHKRIVMFRYLKTLNKTVSALSLPWLCELTG